MWQPAPTAMRAAISLVSMPPLESPPTGALPAMATISGPMAWTSRIIRAGPRRGSRSYRPSMLESSSSASAEAMVARRAARRSLSPKRISPVATVSFSLTTGTAPSRSSVASVLRALR